MLVLSRKVKETIVIGDQVCITIVRMSSGRVSIGIEAPREISVRRGELPARPEVPAEDSTPHVASHGAWRAEHAARACSAPQAQPACPGTRPNTALRAMVAAIRHSACA